MIVLVTLTHRVLKWRCLSLRRAVLPMLLSSDVLSLVCETISLSHCACYDLTGSGLKLFLKCFLFSLTKTWAEPTRRWRNFRASCQRRRRWRRRRSSNPSTGSCRSSTKSTFRTSTWTRRTSPSSTRARHQSHKTFCDVNKFPKEVSLMGTVNLLALTYLGQLFLTM